MRRQVLVISSGPETGAVSELLQCLPEAARKHIQWHELSIELLLESPPDLLILAGFPDPHPALDCLRTLRQRAVRSIILTTLPALVDDDSLAFAVTEADDVLLWPARPSLVQQKVLRFLPADPEVDQTYARLVRELGQANLIGRDPAFLFTVERAARSANSDFPVLITGETGVGKEVFARAIHFMSARRNRPFIPVDCGGIPDHLFENELFGHARGAYTDAYGEQKGMAALADGGAIFLDEVDSLSAGAQAKLLRFLQERQFRPLGSERYISSDVKIISASNRNLRQQVANNQFREDLFFRLNVLHIELKPLRERPQDIALLAQHFLELHVPRGERKCFSPAALRQLASYHWPGNVRELQNVVQRAIVFSRGAQINGCDLVFEDRGAAPATGTFRNARAEAIESFEREYLRELLQRHNGNVTRAARDAGKERRALGRLLKKYGLSSQSHPAGPANTHHHPTQ